MATVTAGCGTTTKETPTSTPTSTTSVTAPIPTEKAVGPGDNSSFSPTVNPVPPGSVCKQIVNGICMR